MKINPIIKSLLLTTMMVLITGLCMASNSETKITVENESELMATVRALSIPGDGTSKIIYIKPGTYVLSDTVRINTSNITIAAEPGVKFFLANNTNRPVLAIGSQEATPSFVINNIHISGLEINGNKANQTSEYDTQFPWIRNNGIDVRATKRLTLENIISGNNRSGGLVVSWGASDIHVNDSIFRNNYYDGVAYYTSEKIFTVNSVMISNGAAGISLDNNFRDSIFSNCILDLNKDVGIFMRNSTKIRFTNCAIQNSKSYAAFLSHDDAKKGVHDVMFSGCQVLNNNGGILVASQNESTYTSIVGTVFRANEKNGRKSIGTAGSVIYQSANIIMK